MDTFQPGAVWLDTDGSAIQAHGGGVLFHEGVYYWYGEYRNTKTGDKGVSCYSSCDLISWRNEGIVLATVPFDEGHDLHPSKVIERPKVVWNGLTRQFVLWLHVDNRDYTYARAGRAVSDSPTGPFTYLGSVRPAGADSRDMTIFKDVDEAAYLVFASEMNSVIRIVKLTDDYLNATDVGSEAFRSAFPHGGRESPALLVHNGHYFFVGSGCSGWDPNPAEYALSPTPLGPWKVQGNPCIGVGAATTFGCQNTFVLPVADRPGSFILMLDRWNPQHLSDSRAVWLPVHLSGDRLSVEWLDRWDLTVFD